MQPSSIAGTGGSHSAFQMLILNESLFAWHAWHGDILNITGAFEFQMFSPSRSYNCCMKRVYKCYPGFFLAWRGRGGYTPLDTLVFLLSHSWAFLVASYEVGNVGFILKAICYRTSIYRVKSTSSRRRSWAYAAGQWGKLPTESYCPVVEKLK